jgi:hypothetical protein
MRCLWGLVSVAATLAVLLPGEAVARSAASFDGAQLTADAGTRSDGSGFSFDLQLQSSFSSDEVPSVASRVDLSIPAGYHLDLGGAPGQTVGFMNATVTTAGTFTDSSPEFAPLVVDDPAVYTADPAAQACAPGQHTALWRASLSVFGNAIPLSIVVDSTTSAAGTSYVLRYCPFVAPSSVFPRGLDISDVGVFFTNRSTAPTSPGSYEWSGIVTPTASGSFGPDPSNAFELRALVPIPDKLTLHAARVPKSTTAVRLSGVLALQGAPAGTVVSIDGGASPNTLFPGLGSVHATTKTKADGTFSLSVRVTGTTYFTARVDGRSGGCVGASTAPAGCRNETLAGPPPATAVIVLPRATDPVFTPTPSDQAIARRSVLRKSDLPDASIAGDAPPPCSGYAPKLHHLVATGQAVSSIIETVDQQAAFYASATVFRTVDDAKSDYGAFSKAASVRCVAQQVAQTSLPGSVGRVTPIAFSRIGTQRHAARVVVTIPGIEKLYFDEIVVRVSRTVIVLDAESLSPEAQLEQFLAAALVLRSGQG